AGFLRAATIWQLPPHRVLYVGDRPSVDAVGARAAGMRCVIVGKSGLGRSFVGVSSFAELRQRLEAGE
ncbi:MAG: HAD hydrolase-like protein, partial [Planctomycetes bacterium]|nr:HAD hydrolase-like protein [Planctomycetota bacterium]